MTFKESELSRELREQGDIPPALFLLFHAGLGGFHPAAKTRNPHMENIYNRYGIVVAGSGICSPERNLSWPEAAEQFGQGMNVVYIHRGSESQDRVTVGNQLPAAKLTVSGLITEAEDREVFDDAVLAPLEPYYDFPLSMGETVVGFVDQTQLYGDRGYIYCADQAPPYEPDYLIRPVRAGVGPRVIDMELQVPLGIGPEQGQRWENRLVLTGLKAVSRIIQEQTKRAYVRRERQEKLNRVLPVGIDQFIRQVARLGLERKPEHVLGQLKYAGHKANYSRFPDNRAPGLGKKLATDKVVAISFPDNGQAFPPERPVIYLCNKDSLAVAIGQYRVNLEGPEAYLAAKERVAEIGGKLQNLVQILVKDYRLGVEYLPIMLSLLTWNNQAKAYLGDGGYQLEENLIDFCAKLQH